MVFLALIVIALIITPIAAIFLRKSRWHKAARIAGIVWTCMVAVLGSGFLLLMWSCTPPSLDTLARKFSTRSVGLGQLVVMSAQDSSLTVIDPAWQMNREGKQFNSGVDAGIPTARWKVYSQLFSKLDLDQGIRKDPDTGDIFFIVKSVGMLDSGYSHGYLYCADVTPSAATKDHVYLPCKLLIDAGSHDADNGGSEAYGFRRVAPQWFVYSQGATN